MPAVLDIVPPRYQPIVATLLALVVYYVGRFFYEGYQTRKKYRTLPGHEKHSWLFGHLPLSIAALAKMPKHASPMLMLYEVKRTHNLPDVFALDFWPFGLPLLINCSPAVSDQFMITRNMPKALCLPAILEPIGGLHNLVSDDGQRWKTWRAAFNPGFSNAHLMTLVPDIVDAVHIFRQKLNELAGKNEPTRLLKPVVRLTIDIIGKVVLDHSFESQTGEDDLVSAFESAIAWMPLGIQYQPSEIWDIRRPFVERRNTRVMNNYIDHQIAQRWATRSQRGRSKYVIDLAFETFLKDKGRAAKDDLDPEFRRDAIDQIKIFLFAGHETSSSTLCYCFYYATKYPKVLARARKELEDVFGKHTDIEEAIRQQPVLLNKLEYITAIIKESLRMHAPANSMRQGSSDFILKDPETGEAYATDGLNVINLAAGLHYDTKTWGEDALQFRPERFFSKTPDGAWVPFSKGIRNCIGQELAMIEMRIVCAVMFAHFDLTLCFDEVEKLKGDGSQFPSDPSGLQEVWGCEMYQSHFSAKPREGLPVRVKKHEW